MLGLSLYENDSLIIGDPTSNDVIVVHFRELSPDRVRLFVQAPREIQVDRLQVAISRLRNNNQQPSQAFADYLQHRGMTT